MLSMKAAWIVAALGLAFVALPAYADASPALSGASPIEIESCVAGTTGGLLISQSNGSFKVEFTNEGAVPADMIRFEIDYGGERLFIRDVGHFAPGVTINHIFRRRGGNVVSSPLFGSAPFTCEVAAVHLTDGTQWTPVGAAAAATPPKRLGNGYLGVMFAPPEAAGVKVALVLPSSPAQNAGIQKGDFITAIDGESVDTISDAITLISASPIGTVLDVTVRRGGTTQTLHATVKAVPANRT